MAQNDKSQYHRSRNRWYNPSLMQWMSPDPIGYDGGDVNLYRFVGNDPMNRVDPSGLFRSQFKGGLSPTAGDYNTIGDRGKTYGNADLTCDCDGKGKLDCSLFVSAIIVVVGVDDPTLKLTYNDPYYQMSGLSVTDAASRRAAVIAHERDHYQTFKEFFDLASQKVRAAESKFNATCGGDCAERAKSLKEHFATFWNQFVPAANFNYDDPGYYKNNGLGNQYSWNFERCGFRMVKKCLNCVTLVAVFVVLLSCQKVRESAPSDTINDANIFFSEIEGAIRASNYHSLDSLLHCWKGNADSVLLNGSPALSYASTRLNLGSMAILLSHGARPTSFRAGWESWANAVSALLVQRIHRSNTLDSVATNALISEGLWMFINNGLDSSYRAIQLPGHDPLYFALSNAKNDSLANELIKRRICTRINYPSVGNALFWAEDSMTIVSLIQAGADTAYRDKQGRSFVEVHRLQGHRHLEGVFKSLGSLPMNVTFQ